MKKLFLITTMCVLSMSVIAIAQQRELKSSTRPIVTLKSVSNKTQDIPVFKVKPGEPRHQYKESDLQLLRRAHTPAPPIPAAKKITLLKQGGTPPASGPGTVQNTPEAKISHLRMSAKDPFKGTLGHLEFNEVRHYDAKNDAVTWYSPMQGMGYMKAHLKVEKGAKYLVDWNVGCSENREFHYSSTGGSQSTQLQEGSHHLLAILDPTSSGTTSLMLWADTQWSFYGVEVTKME